MGGISGNWKAVGGPWRSGQAVGGDALSALTCADVAWLGIPECSLRLQETCRLGTEPGERRIRRGTWEPQGRRDTGPEQRSPLNLQTKPERASRRAEERTPLPQLLSHALWAVRSPGLDGLN